MADLRIVDALEIPTENITGEEKLPTGGSGNYSITLDSVADYTKTKKDLADNTSVDSKVNGVRQELDAHIEDLLNPHQVTKGQIGLGNVDNTADADKPVSNSTQAAIISAVATKADKTYVDGQLTFKANKADVYTKSETYTKAEVDTTFSAYVGGRKAYTTLALAQADQANLPVNTAIEVTSDGANNGTYQWDGTTLTKSDYDPVNLSKKYTDEKTKFVSAYRGVNIFDKYDVQIGKYWFWEKGELWDASASFCATKLIIVEPSTEYRVPIFYGQQFAFFDENRRYISGKANAIVDGFKITTPANAKYIGMTVEVDDLDKMVLSKTAEYQEAYMPRRININDLAIKSDQVINLSTGIKSILGVYSTNIIDKSKTVPNSYIEWNTGRLLPSVNNYNIGGYYEIKPNTLYKTSSNYSQQFCFYDEDFKYISGKIQVDTPSFTFTTPPNAKYAKFTIPDSQLDTLVIAEAALFPKGGVYTPYTVQFKKLLVEPSQINNFSKSVRESANIYDLNILNLDTAKDNSYVDWITGQIGTINGFVVTDYLEVKPSVDYMTDEQYNQQFAFYDADKVYISGKATSLPSRVFTTPPNAKYARFSIPKVLLNTSMVTEKSVFPSTFQPYTVKIAKDLVIDQAESRVTDIWVSADVTDIDVAFTGANAIQLALDSITDASAKNRYVIRVKKGLYKITKATDFLGYRGYPAMILTKDHVDIIGQGEHNTIVWAELPYDDAAIGPSVDGNVYPRHQYQTVYDYADDSEIKDITFVAKNLRYTIHIDNPNGAYATRKYENVGYLFKGDKGSLTAMGCGTSSGEKTYIVGGRSLSDKNVPFASHNNVQFTQPSFWSFKGHNFTALENDQFAWMQSDGSLLEDQLELIGCSFGGKAYVLGYVEVWLTGNTSLNRDSFNHAEWMVTGYGNEPFLFKNEVLGQSLLFKSTAVGTGKNIRFDTASSAYPVLIKNNQTNSDASLYLDSREFTDGYITQDGSIGLPAKAWGCKDLSERVYLYDNGVNYTSLAKRLGNCSTNNLSLGVIINGTTKTILFNKNYSSMTNAQILSEMRAQITDVTIEFVSYGRDYYPTITDVSEAVYNNTATFIPKGSIVTKSGGYVKIANGNDKIYGVALDDIPVMTVTSEGVKKGQGRIMKRGYIYADWTKPHFVLSDIHRPAVGSKFKVVNGQLVSDVNGNISVDIDDAVISINC